MDLTYRRSSHFPAIILFYVALYTLFCLLSWPKLDFDAFNILHWRKQIRTMFVILLLLPWAMLAAREE